MNGCFIFNACHVLLNRVHATLSAWVGRVSAMRVIVQVPGHGVPFSRATVCKGGGVSFRGGLRHSHWLHQGACVFFAENPRFAHGACCLRGRSLPASCPVFPVTTPRISPLPMRSCTNGYKTASSLFLPSFPRKREFTERGKGRPRTMEPRFRGEAGGAWPRQR